MICQSFDGFNEVHKAGAEGSVSLNDVEFNKVSSVVSLPAVALNEDNFNSIYSYLKSTKYCINCYTLAISFDFNFIQEK